MLNQKKMIVEIETALTRCATKNPTGRYAVYVPGSIILGMYDEQKTAQDVASTWIASIPEAVIVVVDRAEYGKR